MSQISSAMTCMKCGHLNRAGIIFCEKCGTQLDGGISLKTHGLAPEILDKIEALADAQLFETVKVDEIRDEKPSTTTLFEAGMCLLLEIEGISESVEIKPFEGIDYIIGRQDPEAEFIPEIDLMPYGGYRMGISRRHAMITLSGKRLSIRDLGSSNGTALNGTKLDKNEAHQLRDGDKLRMGNLLFRVRFT